MHTDPKHLGLSLAPAGIATTGPDQVPALLGGHCQVCGGYFFPKPQYCPGCLQAVEEHTLEGAGSIYTYTVVRTRPPLGLPQPYAVGYIDLAQSGLRIFALFDPGDIESLAIGSPVHLKVGPLGNNNQGEPCSRPYFSLNREGNEHA